MESRATGSLRREARAWGFLLPALTLDTERLADFPDIDLPALVAGRRGS